MAILFHPLSFNILLVINLLKLDIICFMFFSPSFLKVEDEVEASIQEVNRILGNSGFSLEDSSKEANVELSLTLKALLSVEYK